MKKNFNKAKVAEIREKFSSSKETVIIWIFHFSEGNLFDLRNQLEEAGANLKIYKNNIFQKALLDYSLNLKQANAFIFCKKDIYEPLNVLYKFNQNTPEIKRFQGAIYQQKIIEKEKLEEWANLPSKEVLINNICYLLKLPIKNLTMILEKIHKI